MKYLGKWLLKLNKRLYKKLTFLLILVLIPVMVIGYGKAAQEESGILTIALAQEGDDPMAQAVMEDLKENTNLIRFVFCDTPSVAKQMIRDGKADGAWIFAEDMEEKVYEFVQNPSRKNAFVRVIEQDDNIPMRLVREKLSGTVFGHCSAPFYLAHIRNNVPELDEMSDEELMSYYNNFAKDIDLFEFAYLESDSGAQDAQQANYLLTPVRGLLAVIIVLGGLAAAMYFIRDDRAGTFALVPQRNKAVVEFSCQMIAVVNVSLVALIAMLLAGLLGSLWRELPVLLLYAVTVSLFCMTVRRLCGKMTAVGVALPLLVVVMLVICPVFFDLGEVRMVQYIFPPTYYINAITSNRYLLLMAVYALILLTVYYLLGKVLRRR
jgi:ABC-2 type transport system permease protein